MNCCKCSIESCIVPTKVADVSDVVADVSDVVADVVADVSDVVADVSDVVADVSDAVADMNISVDPMDPHAEYIVLDVADISKDAFINAIINNVKTIGVETRAINVKTHAIDSVETRAIGAEIPRPSPSAPPE